MKKLYRLAEGKKAAGICSGIADAYHIDVMLVRLAFVFVTVLTSLWPGIVTYLAGWYLLPEKTDEDADDSPTVHTS
ncbi:MAG: PspC domain-containing protein [Chitinispirillaceae bacterium]|nr:PspC domain-containing protein [Chitinispirillaceae bacterium]